MKIQLNTTKYYANFNEQQIPKSFFESATSSCRYSANYSNVFYCQQLPFSPLLIRLFRIFVPRANIGNNVCSQMHCIRLSLPLE